MRIKFILGGLLLLLTFNTVQAQRPTSRQHYNRRYFRNVVTAYSNYLNKKTAQYWQPDSTGQIYQPDVKINPIYYRLFTPVTLYRSTVWKAMNGQLTDSLMSDDRQARASSNERLLPIRHGLIEKDEAITDEMDKALLFTYLNHPTMVRQTEEEVMSNRAFNEQLMPGYIRKQRMTDQIRDKRWIDPDVDQHLVIHKPNFWTHTVNVSLQFTQNYISSNWYKGGESSNSMLSSLDVSMNYNDQQRIQFDNRLEWQLGFISSRADSIHNTKPNSDLLRLTSKLGVKAFSTWYYTIQAELSTQLFSNYSTNSYDLSSSFMSPFYLKFDLGLDYKKSLKNLTFSSVISPLSYKLTYVDNDKVDVTNFGMKEGMRSMNEIGSNLQINSKWTIISEIVWETRFSYFTTYKRAEIEWENTINFQLNRYLSTKLFVHARFDDGVEKDDDNDSYFQLSELLSFGLSYNF